MLDDFVQYFSIYNKRGCTQLTLAQTYSYHILIHSSSRSSRLATFTAAAAIRIVPAASQNRLHRRR